MGNVTSVLEITRTLLGQVIWLPLKRTVCRIYTILYRVNVGMVVMVTNIVGSFQHQTIPLCRKEEVYRRYQLPGIIRGYRPLLSPWQCIMSLFQATNETLNFWTHFIPACYFAWKIWDLSTKWDFLDPYTWPLLCFMVTVVEYLLVSSLAHTFSCLSQKALYICFFMDFAAISLSLYGGSILYRAYVFPRSFQNTQFSEIYPFVSAFNAVFCTTITCSSPFISRRAIQKVLKLVTFAIPFCWAIIPLSYRFMYCDPTISNYQSALPLHFRLYISQFCGVIFYGSHLPERLAPGRFDIIGQSHNLWHVFNVIGTYYLMLGALDDMEMRRAEILGNNWLPAAFWSTWGFLFVVIANASVIVFFSRRVHKLIKGGLKMQLKTKQEEAEENRNKLDLPRCRSDGLCNRICEGESDTKSNKLIPENISE